MVGRKAENVHSHIIHNSVAHQRMELFGCQRAGPILIP